MKTFHLLIILAGSLFFIVACSTSKTATSSTTTSTAPKVVKGAITQEDADYISKKMSITTVADLTEGSTIYSAECGVCHGLKKPNARTEDQWKSIVPNMVAKANARAGKEEINPRQKELILKYLVALCYK